MQTQTLLSRAGSLLPELTERLQKLVEQESPSDSPPHVNAAAQLVQSWAAEIGGTSTFHPQTGFGNVLEIAFGSGQTNRRPVLLLGHLDTVWPLGTLAAMPWKMEDGRLWGPGVVDMKAGVVMALTACKLLCEQGSCPPVRFLLNSDEEVGSPVSRPITERLAQESAAVFVLEPAQGLAYKTSRKGVGNFFITVRGVAAHSGVDFERGHSAIRELARVVEIVSNFTDLGKGRTVNCGVIAGGTRSNVIAEQAHCEVDVRVSSIEDASEVERLFRKLKATDGGCTVEVTGGLNRPPMERSAGTAALFARARSLAAELGFDLEEASTGGGSDGNFTAALGVPTLDGMGAVGGGAHAANEHVVVEHLAPRTALLAAIIADSSESRI